MAHKKKDRRTMATTRKRSDRKAADEERPARWRGATVVVTDGEVEEFFAILQKMRDAARSFAARGGGGEKKAKEEEERKGKRASRWRPAFEREDFAVAGFVKDADRRSKQISMTAAAESSKGRSKSSETAVGEEEEGSVAAESRKRRSRLRDAAMAEEDSAAAESSKRRWRSKEAAMAEDEEESVAENGIPCGFLDLNVEPAIEE